MQLLRRAEGEECGGVQRGAPPQLVREPPTPAGTAKQPHLCQSIRPNRVSHPFRPPLITQPSSVASKVAFSKFTFFFETNPSGGALRNGHIRHWKQRRPPPPPSSARKAQGGWLARDVGRKQRARLQRTRDGDLGIEHSPVHRFT